MLQDEAVDSFASTLQDVWDQQASRWAGGGRFELHSTLTTMLTDTALPWAGVPAGAGSARQRRQELTDRIDAAGSVGPWDWWGRLVRRRSERWAAGVVADIREERLDADPRSMARRVADHQESGQTLPVDVAAVELLNVLRPIVAIGRFAVFAAVALWSFPEWREQIRAGDDACARRFVHEVRRYYPFFPAVGGKTLRRVDIVGHRLPVGTWVLLDLYGTNHDPRSWDEPQAFRPERFGDGEPGPYDFVPQGGGDYVSGHRCPGEQRTIAAMTRIVRLLARPGFALPSQDLTYSLSRMPTLPRSGVVLEHS